MRSKVVDRILKEMENDPWHVKLKREIKLWIWVNKCLTRKYWDKSYQNYIFKKR